MKQKKQRQKQINISISKIINWPISQNEIKFQITFTSQQSGQTILSKQIKGQYNSQNRIMYLNCNQKIKYTIDQFNISIRLAEKLGYAGQIILGDFNLNLEHLKQNQYLKFPIKDKHQILIIEIYKPKIKSNTKSIEKTQIKSLLHNQLNNNNNIMNYSRCLSKQNQAFIKQKQDFLQKIINKSQSSSRTLNLNSNNNRFLPSQNFIRGSIYAKTNSKTQFRDSSNKKQTFSQNKRPDSNLSRHNSQSKKSINRLKNNPFTQKYVLEVNSLNVLPYDQYYQSQSRVLKSNLHQLQRPQSQSYKIADKYRKQVLKMSRPNVYNSKYSEYF